MDVLDPVPNFYINLTKVSNERKIIKGSKCKKRVKTSPFFNTETSTGKYIHLYAFK